jgi:acetylornithine/succinyldiaminopimelate/putrescine aminotransferase
MPTNREWMTRLALIENQDSTYKPAEFPLVFSKADGCYVWDAEGRKYLDVCAGFGVMALGHQHPEIVKVMRDSSSIMHGMGDVYPSVDKVELLEFLSRKVPFDHPRISLSLTGGQAVEVALKSAMLSTGNMGVIAFEGAYHGLDLGVLPVTWRKDFSKPFEGWGNRRQVRYLPWNANPKELQGASDDLKANGFDLAAVIVEPIQGRAGVRMPRRGFLEDLREFCDGQGGLLIYDEILTGCGRSGRLSHGEQVPADLVCLGKALGGGMPISACIGSQKVMNAWPVSSGEAIHTGTFFGHPLSCRVAIASLKVMTEQNLMQRAQDVGEWLMGELDELRRRWPQEIAEVRGQGLMIAIETNRPGRGAWLMNQLRQHGVVALASGDQGQSLTLTPPLVISKEQLLVFVTTLEKVFREG